MKTAYVRFMCDVTHQSANQFLQVLDDIVRHNYTDLCLMLSTGGGGTYQGITMYNALKNAPLKVETINIGLVQSVAMAIFCAGTVRRAVPESRFLMHPVVWTLNGTFTEQQLVEFLDQLKSDEENLSASIAGATGKSVDQIAKDIRAHRLLTPVEAKDYGLVTSVGNISIPNGSSITHIG